MEDCNGLRNDQPGLGCETIANFLNVRKVELSLDNYWNLRATLMSLGTIDDECG
jgi:hypothetical protein